MSFNESNLYGQTRRDNMQNNSSKNFMEEVSYGRLGTTKTLNSTVNGNALKPPLATQQQSAVWNSTANSINSKQIMNNGILSNHPLDEPSITPSPSIQNSTAASVSSNVTSASNHSTMTAEVMAFLLQPKVP
uniref:Period n=1 Tax=Ditylenchus dipsaci TaxID=166011 RepID=A0A915DCI4_9BILA